MKKILIFLSITLLCQLGFSQRRIVEKATIPMFSFSYGYHFPWGDMGDRFGNSSMIGGDFNIKTTNGWTYGVDFRYIFGSTVKEDDILDGIMTSNNNIINQYGEYASIIISERGYSAGGSFGKVFPVFAKNPNSGIYLRGGLGLLEHKINIENQANNAPQVLDDYKKGYDRLTNGLAANLFLGYLYIGANQLSNFYIGVDVYHSWTMSRRDFDFATMKVDDTKRNDNLFGLKMGWVVPLYRRIPDNYFTY